MGLFDGGGFDMGALMDMINPVGTANAGEIPPVPGVGPNGAPQGGLTTDNLLASNPLPSPQPIVPPPVPAVPPTPPVDATRSLAATPVASAIPANPSIDQTTTGSAVQAATPLGAALTGNTDVSARAKTADEEQKKKLDTLAAGLRGVQAPKAPELQKISSPSGPRPTGQIKSGDLQALLMALNAGAGPPRPLTLGR